MNKVTSRIYKATLLLLLACCPNAVAETNWARGPIELGNQYPLALVHTSLSPTSTEVLEKNHYKVRTALIWSNNLTLKEDQYIHDAETRVTPLELHWGLGGNLQASIKAPLIWRGGGLLDSTIDNWHQFFGMPRGERDKIEDNEFSLSGINDDGSIYDLHSDGFHLGDIDLSLKYLLTKGDNKMPAFSLIGTIRVPTAHGSYGQDSIDLLVGGLASKKWEDLTLYSGASYSYFLDNQIKNLSYQEHNFSGFINLEYLAWDNIGIHIGFSAYSEMLDGASGFPDHSVYFDSGFKYHHSKDTDFEFLVRENPSDGDGTVDVSFLFGISHRNSI